MKTLKKEVVRQYRKDMYGSLWLSWVGIVILALGFSMLHVVKATQSTLLALLTVGITILGMALMGLAFAYRGHPERIARKDSDNYKLLNRWVRYSGELLSAFPTSTIGSKYRERWAIDRLTVRAQGLNYFYAQQKSFYDEEKKIDWDNLPPDQGERLKKRRTKDEEAMKNHIRWVKSLFLNFWDLVTEKDGIGILAGPDWQDPERFRQLVLVQEQIAQSAISVVETNDK